GQGGFWGGGGARGGGARAAGHPNRVEKGEKRPPGVRRTPGGQPAPPLFEKEKMMTLRLGEIAPDFEAETTEGRIRFHEWIGDSWAVLFSHPKNYTPVCTTELGYMAKIKS